MIEVFAFIIGLYIVFRVLTAVIIPKYAHWKIKCYQDEIKKENPEIYKSKSKAYTGKIHPSIKEYYRDKEEINLKRTKHEREQI